MAGKLMGEQFRRQIEAATSAWRSAEQAARESAQAIDRSSRMLSQRQYLLATLVGIFSLIHQREVHTHTQSFSQALRSALHAHFGDACPVLGGQAGLHLVLCLPDGPPDTAVVRAAWALGVAARPLSAYYAGQAGANGLLLGYGIAEETRIPELVGRLAQAVLG